MDHRTIAEEIVYYTRKRSANKKHYLRDFGSKGSEIYIECTKQIERLKELAAKKGMQASPMKQKRISMRRKNALKILCKGDSPSFARFHEVCLELMQIGLVQRRGEPCLQHFELTPSGVDYCKQLGYR